MSRPSTTISRERPEPLTAANRMKKALEGNFIEMELEVPGADIVGFEHEAVTPEDRAALAAAVAALEDGFALFTIAAEAACRAESVEVEAGHEDHEEGAADAEEEEAEHMEFRVHYVLSCENPAAIMWMEFPYFARFPGAEELEVNLLTNDGQFSYEVARDAPRVAFGG